MSTQAAIDALVAQLVKAKDEIAAQLEAATLNVQAQLVDAGVVEDIDLSALAGIAQALDDLVPDAPAPTEDTEATTEAAEGADEADEPVEDPDQLALTDDEADE